MYFLNGNDTKHILKEYVYHKKMFAVRNKGYNEHRHHGIIVNNELYFHIEDILYLMKIDPRSINNNVTYFRLLFHIRNNGYNIVRKITANDDSDIYSSTDAIGIANYDSSINKTSTRIQNLSDITNDNDALAAINNPETELNILESRSQCLGISDTDVNGEYNTQSKLQNTNDFSFGMTYDNDSPLESIRVNLVNCYNYVHNFRSIIDACISEIHTNFYLYKRHKNFLRTQEPCAELLIVQMSDVFKFEQPNKIHCILGDDVFAMLKVTKVTRLRCKNDPALSKEHVKIKKGAKYGQKISNRYLRG